MHPVDPTLRSGEPSNPDEENLLLGDGFEPPVDVGSDELSGETGLDLSDAGDLGDKVPDDEESGRVVQAPD